MAYVNALRQVVEQEIVRHKTVMDNCASVIVTLESVHTTSNLRTVQSLRDDLRRSSEDLQGALDRLNQFLTAKTAAASRGGKSARPMDRDQDKSKKKMAKRTELTCVKGELARSKIRLTEREDQVAALIEDGLRVSFQKEVLEEEIAELRNAAGRRNLQASSRNSFVQGGGL